MDEIRKYQRWYDQIIERARYRRLDIYKETHHIVPRAFGGGDDPENLVDLTYREHFLAHWLLTKTTTGYPRRQMVYALNCMTMQNGMRIIAGWQFEIAKRTLADEVSRRFRQRQYRRKELRRDRIRAKRRELAENGLRAHQDAAKLRDVRSKGNELSKLAADIIRADPKTLRNLEYYRGPRRKRKSSNRPILEQLYKFSAK